MSELRDVVEELVVRQETVTRALVACASDVYMILTGEKAGNPEDALAIFVRELAPLILTPEQLRDPSD